MKNKPSFPYLSAGAAAVMGLLLSLPGVTVASAVTPVIQAQADTSAPATTPPAKSAMPEKAHARLSATDRAEIRIKDLHAKLKIAPAQETQWEAVAQAMRDNAATMEDLAGKRAASAGSMNAVDDLKSYEQIAEAHVDGLKSFIPAFEALYNTMSDDQKKIADAMFEHQHHGGKMKKEPKSK